MLKEIKSGNQVVNIGDNTKMTTTFSANIDIDAPIETVWSVLTDFERYGEWNRFIPRIDVDGEIGGAVILYVQLSDRPGTALRKTPEILTVFSSPTQLGWQPPRQRFLKASRLQTLTKLSDTRTHYMTEEPFGGLLSPLVIWLYGAAVQRGFQWMAEDLKEEAEKRYGSH